MEIKIIIILSILLVISVLTIIIYRKKLIKLSETLSIYKDKVGKDYEKDIKFLNTLISERILYVKENIIPNMNDDKVIKDEEYNTLLFSMVDEITNITSDSYKELIEFYVNDFESFISLRISSILQPYIVYKNVKMFKGNGLPKDVDIIKYYNKKTDDILESLGDKN